MAPDWSVAKLELEMNMNILNLTNKNLKVINNVSYNTTYRQALVLFKEKHKLSTKKDQSFYISIIDPNVNNFFFIQTKSSIIFN